jgi:hypothetical protein
MLLMLTLLAGCGEDTPAETPAPSAAILSQGDCFVVAEDNSSGITKYSYTIKDKSGAELESAICANQPRVAVINDDLLGVRFYVNDKTFCRYYDLKNGRVSDSFFNAFWDNGKLVAYHDYDNGHRLMVRDMFDENGYYYELDLDVQALSITVTACEQSEDTGDLTVTYTYGDGGAEYSATLPTKPAESEDK